MWIQKQTNRNIKQHLKTKNGRTTHNRTYKTSHRPKPDLLICFSSVRAQPLSIPASVGPGECSAGMRSECSAMRKEWGVFIYLYQTRLMGLEDTPTLAPETTQM